MYEKVFEALPHVKEIWVTADGHFHLHPHNGGEHILRGEQPISIGEQPELKTEPLTNQTEQNEHKPDNSHSRRGRPKK